MAQTSLLLRSKNGDPLNRLALSLVDQMADYIDSLDAFELQGSPTSLLGDGTEGVVTISLVAARFESPETVDVQKVKQILEIAESYGFDLVLDGPESFLQALGDKIANESKQQ